MAATLEELGFAVTLLLNATRLALYRALIPFERDFVGSNFMIPIEPPSTSHPTPAPGASLCTGAEKLWAKT
jgi:hypothetical protein